MRLECVLTDPTPNAIVNQRIVTHLFLITDHSDLAPGEREEFFRLLLLLGRKLIRVWSHLDDYAKHEDGLVATCREAGPPNAGAAQHVMWSQDLYFEFDEFLVQVKSALDHLVKIPVPLLGRGVWNLATFGNHGEAVAKALENNLPAAIRERARGLREVILDPHKAWLADTIAARDKINHFIQGGVAANLLTVQWVDNNGNLEVRTPMWSPDQTIRQFMGVVWENLIRLTEDFVASFLSFRMKPGLGLFHGIAEGGSSVSPWLALSEEDGRRLIERLREESSKRGDGTAPGAT